MGRISVSRFIAAPPKRVYAIASDLEGLAARITSIKHMEVLTGGPIKKGSQFRVGRAMQGIEASAEMTVSACDEPKSFQIGCTSAGCRYEIRFRFEPDGTGTNFVLEFGWMPLSFGAKLTSPLHDGKIKKALKMCDQDLDELKYAAEQPEAKAA